MPDDNEFTDRSYPDALSGPYGKTNTPPPLPPGSEPPPPAPPEENLLVAVPFASQFDRPDAPEPGVRPFQRVPGAPSTWRHPILGGKATAFVLLYGDYHAMHRECLDALLATTDRDILEVRVGSNALCLPSVQYVDSLVAAGRVAAHYRSAENVRKYPLMRRMFRDNERPIETNYILWFDDDTICDRDPDWFEALGQAIADGHPKGARMFGPVQRSVLSPSQLEWVKAAPWYRGRPLRDKFGVEHHHANQSHFITGSFWALHADTMRECDVPDERIGHNGGDVMIGEQVHQAGYSIAPFSSNKQHVRWSAYRRRGLSEPPAGSS